MSHLVSYIFMFFYQEPVKV